MKPVASDATRASHELQPFAPRTARQAWWLSAVFHAALFVLCALLWQRHTPQGVPSTNRVGEIVLAVSTNERTEYLQFSESESESQSESDSKSSSTSPDDTSSDTGPLPHDGTAVTSLPASLRLPMPDAALPPALDLAAPRTSGATTVKLPSNTDYSEFLAAERARIRSQMPQGEPVEVALFGGPPSVGRSFVFVIDRSKSMGGSGVNALRPAAEELTAALAHLEPVHRFTVIAYHHQNTYLDGPRLIPATPANQYRVTPFLNGLATFGQTEHQLALSAALHLKPDVIYLFTDGGDPQLTVPELRSLAADAAKQNTTIHCVQFGLGPLRDNEGFLMRLADACSGGYTYVDLAQSK